MPFNLSKILTSKITKQTEMSSLNGDDILEIIKPSGAKVRNEHILAGLNKKREQNFQMAYNWRVIMPSTSSSGIGSAMMDLDVAHDDAKIVLASGETDGEINHRVTDINVPFKNFDVRTSTFRNSHLHTANHRTIGTVSITADEMEDGYTTKYFTDWQNLVANDDGTYNPPVVYKRDVTVVRMTNNGLDLHISVLKGAFPSEIGALSYSYESSNVLSLSVTLSIDSVVHKIIPLAKLRKMIDGRDKNLRNASLEFSVDVAGRSIDFKVDERYLNKYRDIIKQAEDFIDDKYYPDEISKIRKFL